MRHRMSVLFATGIMALGSGSTYADPVSYPPLFLPTNSVVCLSIVRKSFPERATEDIAKRSKPRRSPSSTRSPILSIDIRFLLPVL